MQRPDESLAFQVRKTALDQTRVAVLPARGALAADNVLLRVERFAFTANNITYAVMGEPLKYWQLFPAPEGWGVIPIWGFGVVEQSAHPEIALGERLFGYLPMATHLVIEPAQVSKRGLSDGAEHRRGVAPVYNQYGRVSGDPAFEGLSGDYQALLKPLFMLSFLVDDFLGEADFFGARAVLLTSASSKTAIGLAYLLKRRAGVRVIGLTSKLNEAFVAGLGVYDEIRTYDAVADIADVPSAIVDMAGNAGMLAELHRRLGKNLRYSCRVGLTHLDREELPRDLPGAKPVWFFAPDQIKKRSEEWGRGGIEQRIGEVWPGLVALFEANGSIEFGAGEAAVRKVYAATLAGKARPDVSHMLSLLP